jgi:hypothetical protein
MLKEAKLAMQVSGSDYDAEIASLLMSAANDLQMAGIVFEGTVTFTVSQSTGEIVDGCTVTNELIKRALITYAQAHANWQPEARAARFRESYEGMKRSMRSATGFTQWGDEE